MRVINDRDLLAEQVKAGCTCGGCGADRWRPPDCRGCGFHEKEAARRKKLPLVRLENGLAGIYLGKQKKLPKVSEDELWRR